MLTNDGQGIESLSNHTFPVTGCHDLLGGGAHV
jgi:hypothetical protein